MLFAEWYRICELPGANDAACAHYILQLQQSGLLKGDDMSDRFFRCLTVTFFRNRYWYGIILKFWSLLSSFPLIYSFYPGTFCITLLIFWGDKFCPSAITSTSPSPLLPCYWHLLKTCILNPEGKYIVLLCCFSYSFFSPWLSLFLFC